MRLFGRPSLVDGVEEFSVEMESYLVSFLHDTAVGSVAGHCLFVDKCKTSPLRFSVTAPWESLAVGLWCGCARGCCEQDDSE